MNRIGYSVKLNTNLRKLLQMNKLFSRIRSVQCRISPYLQKCPRNDEAIREGLNSGFASHGSDWHSGLCI